MSAVLATHLDTTQGKAARYGTTTTSWRQERPGLWVATRGGITVGAIHLATPSVDVTSAPRFSTLVQARAAAPLISAPPLLASQQTRSGLLSKVGVLRTSLRNVVRFSVV